MANILTLVSAEKNYTVRIFPRKQFIDIIKPVIARKYALVNDSLLRKIYLTKNMTREEQKIK